MKNKAYLVILVVSLILTFAVAPLRMFQLFEAPSLSVGTLMRGIIFWAVTVYFLTRYSNIVKPYRIVLMVLLADLLPDIIVRVFMRDFIVTLPSFPNTLLQIIVVLLGWWYTTFNKTGKVIVALANLLICIGVSSYGFVLWNELGFVKDSRFKKLEIVEILKRADSALLQDSIISKFQDKNLIVYVGGEKDDKNKIGFSFLQKVQEQFEGDQSVAILALLCLDNPENQDQSTPLMENSKFPVICMDRDKSQLKRFALYHWYVVDRNKEIRCRNKIAHQDNSDMQKELQTFKGLIGWLNENTK